MKHKVQLPYILCRVRKRKRKSNKTPEYGIDTIKFKRPMCSLLKTLSPWREKIINFFFCVQKTNAFPFLHSKIWRMYANNLGSKKPQKLEDWSTHANLSFCRHSNHPLLPWACSATGPWQIAIISFNPNHHFNQKRWGSLEFVQQG